MTRPAIFSLGWSLREVILLMTVIALVIALLNYHFGAGFHAHRLPYSVDKEKLYLRVIAADDFSPVANVEVDLTWVGFGADGGSHGGLVKTDQNGIAYIPNGHLTGPIQVYLRAPKGSRFRDTSFTDHHSMLTGRPDGSYYPSVFRLGVNQSNDRDFAHTLR